MSPAPSLSPSPYPIAVFPNYIARQSETIVMTEKLLSLADDSFTVKTIDGREILQVKGENLSLSHRKRVCNMQGTHLFTIRKEVMHFPASFYAEDPSGNRIFEVKGKLSLGTSKAVGHFANAAHQGQQESLFMHGSFFNAQTTITNEANNEVVALIDRKMFNARQFFGGRQTYAVTIAPGVDIALIMAMCVCLDERRDQNQQENGI